MSDSEMKNEKKMQKKKKTKKQKKEKKQHKHKSRSRDKNAIEIKSNQRQSNDEQIDQSQDEMFGPTLPPHLQSKPANEVDEEHNVSIIGPIMPAQLKTDSQHIVNNADEDNDEGMYGPVPMSSSLSSMTVAQIELEERALEMKLSKFETSDSGANEQKVREEWMLELPDVGLKAGLASIRRTFHTGKERPDFSDRSDWTKTPQDEKCVTSSSKTAAKSETKSQSIFEQQRDIDQEKIAKKLKKKQKREESLVEMHQKKLLKEKRKKEKELSAAGAKAERRPFSREVDLKMNKIDSNQTKAIVDKAKILNTKFSSGQTKYL